MSFYSVLDYLTDQAVPGMPLGSKLNTKPTDTPMFKDCQPSEIIRDDDWISPLIRQHCIASGWLASVPMPAGPFVQPSPAGRVTLENQVTARLVRTIIPQVRRALRQVQRQEQDGTQPYLRSSPPRFVPGDHVNMTIDLTPAPYKINGEPDLLIYQDKDFGSDAEDWPNIANRAPGDIKGSWKFNRDLEETDPRFYWAAWQVHFYMWDRNAQYGFIITDTELYCMRKQYGGALSITPPFRFAATATRAQLESGTVTELPAPLALFFLAYLAGEGGEDGAWTAQYSP